MGSANVSPDISGQDGGFFFGSRPRHELNPTAVEICRKIIEAAMLFRFPPDEQTNPESAQSIIINEMSAGFHARHYIHRPRAETMILESLKPRKTTILWAERGAGKTTLLRRLAEHPELTGAGADGFVQPSRELEISERSTPTKSFVYMELSADSIPLHYPVDGMTSHDVLAFVFDHLFRQFISDTKERRLGDGWTAYQAQNSRCLADFQRQVVALQPSIATPAMWRSAISEPRLELAWRAGKSMETSPTFAGHSLSEFLTYLYIEHSHSVTLILDNLDHLNPSDQVKIAVSLAEVIRKSKGCCCAIAIRKSSLLRIRDQLEPVGGYTDIEVDQDHNIIQAETPFIRDVLQDRLMVIRELADRLVAATQISHGAEVAQALSNLLARVSDIFEVLLRVSFATVANNSFLESLRVWHNGSIRQIGHTASRMLFDATTDADPTSPYAKLEQLLRSVPSLGDPEWGRWSLDNRIILRTHLFRKFFFSNDRPNRVPRCFPLQRLDRRGHGRHIVFSKMRILDLLIRSDYCTLQAIREQFVEFGVDSVAVDDALRTLALPRYPGDTGLIWIDSVGIPRDCSPSEAHAIEIGIQDAGAFFRSSYCRTPDFLFWAASQNQRALRCLRSSLRFYNSDYDSGDNEVIFAHYSRPPFRALVGAHYLADMILPKFKVECPEPPMGDLPDTGYWTYIDHLFEVFGSEMYPERAQNLISGFVGDLKTANLLLPGEGEEINRVLTPVKDYFTRMRPVIDETADISDS